ncbi:MAG TPA: hypothetical protein VN026_12800 [Bacteroidia bacterium]|jgi:hypothetical protein|nr:hypothetical protein [Bacteroidia bacterium]
MKKTTKHAVMRKMQQPAVTAVTRVTKTNSAKRNKTFAIARLTLMEYTNDEIKVFESGTLREIAKMLLDRELRLVDKIVIPPEEVKTTENILADENTIDHRKIIHTPKAYGDWKGSDFIYALEDIQGDIENGKYTTIEQCMENRYFRDCDKEDQEQLIDIANWYLHINE